MISVLLDTEIGSVKASKARLLPICKIEKVGKNVQYKYGLAEFGQFDSTGAYKNNLYKTVLDPKYDTMYGELYEVDDIVVLGTLHNKDIISTKPEEYFDTSKYLYYSYELYQYDGFYGRIFCKTLADFKLSDDRKLVTVMDCNGHWGAVNWNLEEIVPFDKYDYIGGFHNGLARVKTGKVTNGRINTSVKWGVIDVTGKEILPSIYSNLYFKGSNIYIQEKKNTPETKISIESLDHTSYVKFKEIERQVEIGKKQILYNKSEEPMTSEYFNRRAREQMEDAFDGEEGTGWNID